MLGQRNIFGKTKLETTIERIKAFEPEEGYYVAFKGFSEYMNPPESDYIKREDAQKITAEWLSGYITEQKEKLTADVVEVVRCKDCIHNEHNAEDPNALCELYYGMTDQYGFCSCGEKRL